MSVASTTLCVLSNIGFRFYNFGVQRNNAVVPRSNLHNNSDKTHNTTIPQLNDFNAVVTFTANVLDQALDSATTKFNELDSTTQTAERLKFVLQQSFDKVCDDTQFAEATFKTNKLTHTFNVKITIDKHQRLTCTYSIEDEIFQDALIDVQNTNFLQNVESNVNRTVRGPLNIHEDKREKYKDFSTNLNFK